MIDYANNFSNILLTYHICPIYLPTGRIILSKQKDKQPWFIH